jgi:hypothetical protein
MLRGQRNGSPRPLIRLYKTFLSDTYFESYARDARINASNSSRQVVITNVRFQIETENDRQCFLKFSNIKFHENTSIGSRDCFVRIKAWTE